MLRKENIRQESSQPLYLQVAELVIKMIEDGALSKNDPLPSVNELYARLGISRVTAVNAYKHLGKMGIINPRHGKGFYVSKVQGLRTQRVFLLFDAMNNYKEVLYRSFIDELGPDFTIDVFFHYYNIKQFSRFLKNNLGDYNYYVIIPHFNQDISGLLKDLPMDSLLLLDGDVPTISQCAGIFQQFEKDVYHALTEGLHLMHKYNRINLFAGSDFQFIPDGIRQGLSRFCIENGFEHEEIILNPDSTIKKGEVYLAFSENDLVTLLQMSKATGLKVGIDFGLISYDDTPLKAVLADGITTISTDFIYMGKMAARMIKEGIRTKIECPSSLIIRNSL